MDNARYAYEQTLATLETQRILLDNLTIRAPISGIVTQRDIQPGMLVSNGFLAFRIVDPSSYILTISPPERELPRLAIGQVAKITIDALRGREFDAKIRRINPSVDPISGTIKVVLDFDEDVRKLLHDSSFARVKLVMATLQNVLLAPKEAILEEEGRQYVFVVRKPPAAADSAPLAPGEQPIDASEEETFIAERVEVQTGLEDAQRVQLITGVAESDLLITNGQYTLKPGSRVRLTSVRDAVWQNADSTADEALERAKAKRATGGAGQAGEAADSGADGGSRRD
jgi:membrane fusion protein (multidrug efflux system)